MNSDLEISTYRGVPLVLNGTLDGTMVWELLKPTTARNSEMETKVRMMLCESIKSRSE